LKKRTDFPSKPCVSNIDRALTALSAEDLRDLIRGIIPRLDDKTLFQLANGIIERAAGSKIVYQDPSWEGEQSAGSN
jgi:hypothetical protein